MGTTWGWQDPGGPHVGPMKFAIWENVVITVSADALPPNGAGASADALLTDKISMFYDICLLMILCVLCSYMSLSNMANKIL